MLTFTNTIFFSKISFFFSRNQVLQHRVPKAFLVDLSDYWASRPKWVYYKQFYTNGLNIKQIKQKTPSPSFFLRCSIILIGGTTWPLLFQTEKSIKLETSLHSVSRKHIHDGYLSQPNQRSVFSKESLESILKLYLYDPVSTCLRFIHLVLLFGPVLILLPLILIGPKTSYGITSPDKLSSTLSSDKAGAQLWYKYLTWSMEMAGPSFIKVI